MRRALLLLLLAGARGLAAFGGTSETWLGGTQPWDSVPYRELNLGIQARGGDGHAALGPLAEWGIFDPLMLGGIWMLPVDGGPGGAELLLKLREPAFPHWRPALAAYGRLHYDGRSGSRALPGLVLAVEPWDHSLAANLEYSASTGLLLRLGYWTPYLTSFLRVGCEGLMLQSAAPWVLLPQVTFQAPGDLSAVLGAQTLSDGSGPWTWLARLSWQIFPSP